MKNTFEGLTSRWDTTEERIRKLEDMSIALSQTEMQREKIMKKQQNIQKLWNSFKECSICVIGIPEEKKEMQQKKNLN